MADDRRWKEKRDGPFYPGPSQEERAQRKVTATEAGFPDRIEPAQKSRSARLTEIGQAFAPLPRLSRRRRTKFDPRSSRVGRGKNEPHDWLRNREIGMGSREPAPTTPVGRFAAASDSVAQRKEVERKFAEEQQQFAEEDMRRRR